MTEPGPELGYRRSVADDRRERRQKSVHGRSEFMRHLFGKRYHAIIDLDEFTAGNGGSDGRRVGIGMRIGGGRDHQRGAAQQGQPPLHLIATDDAMTFRGPGPGLQGIDHEALEEVAAAFRIVGLSLRPQLQKMLTVRMRLGLVDRVTGGPCPPRGIDVGGSRKDECLDAMAMAAPV